MPGGTPMLELPRLADRWGVGRLWLKDESRNPTWSFKDRAAALAAAHARELGAPGMIVASTGNAAAAVAAAARRLGMPAIVLVARGIDPIMAALTRSYGAYLLSTPTKKDRWQIMRDAVELGGMYPGCNYVDPPVGSHPYLADGYKTTGLEVWEQLDRRSPDWVFAPLGHADNLFGIFRAFEELALMELTATRPRLGGGEAYGSLDDALRSGLDVFREMPTEPPTVATSIATPQSTYQALAAVRGSDGFACRLENEEILDAHRALVDAEGISCEVTAAAGLAALRRAVEDQVVSRDAEVVFVSTSAGTKSLAMAPGLDHAESPSGAIAEVHDFETAVEALQRMAFPLILD